VVPIWLMRSASMVRLSCICEITRDFLMVADSPSCRRTMTNAVRGVSRRLWAAVGGSLRTARVLMKVIAFYAVPAIV
jgi:hypothetical protein